MKTVLKVALGIVLGAVLLVGGCTAVLSAGVDQAEKDREARGKSAAQVKAVKLGTPRGEVIARLGKPQDEQEMDLEGRDADSSCIYYPHKSAALDLWQLCFDGDGKLKSRSRF